MNGRRSLVIAATMICWISEPGRDFASADNFSSGFDSGASDRAGTTVLNRTSPELPAGLDGGSTDQPLGMNPLWGIPLSVLNATRERPLFAPSRRPPGAAVIASPAGATKTAMPAAAAKPALHLVGTVEGNNEGYAVFINTTTHAVVRLKTGEGQDGWILRSVGEREAVLYNNDRTEVLELPSITGLSK